MADDEATRELRLVIAALEVVLGKGLPIEARQDRDRVRELVRECIDGEPRPRQPATEK